MSSIFATLALAAVLHLPADATANVEAVSHTPLHASQVPIESDPSLVPSAIRDAFFPGSALYEDAVKRERAVLKLGEEQQEPTPTFSEPRRTNYIGLDPERTGPIAQSELDEVPQRYESFQYIEGRAKAQYTVELTGEFTVSEYPNYKIAQKLAGFPADGSHGTTWPWYEFWIPSDGSMVYALDASSEEFLGAASVDSDSFRALDAAKIKASQAEHERLLATETALEKAQRSPVLLAAGLMFAAAGLAFLFYPRSRNFRSSPQ